MPQIHDTELDVELDVIELNYLGHPIENFPRRPNVVSHRGHQIKINVTITQVAADTEYVTIGASVYAYGPERIGEEAHVSRSWSLWGSEPRVTKEIDPNDMPRTFSIVVSMADVDDHLGQGPYGGLVSVNQSTEQPDDPTLVSSGEELFYIEFTSM